jgi:serine/threonine protein kinase/Tol biopolymer transport system component
MEIALPQRVRFGVFELDLKAGELYKRGRVVLLQEQPFQVLLMLVEHRGELATREEIRRKLWPNDTVVEFDHAINTAIKKLRQTLGDSAQKPRYIETVGRRGYRLMMPVEWIGAIPAGVEGTTSQNGAPHEFKFQPGVMTGRRVSHYRVLEVLGGGGMGVVYRAEDIKLGRRVALKFLPEELGNDARTLERFEREARSASAVEHPNICPIYEFGEHEGQPFMVMQLLEGQTLRERIGAGGSASLPFRTDELLDLAIQAVEGLDSAHQKGIIHRDIKPANIFITNRGEVKILDFGLAKLTDASVTAILPSEAEVNGLNSPLRDATEKRAADLGLTRTGVALGTAAYMSPEQVRGEKLDGRTDLFSFGLVLYEMATGHPAFSGQTAAILHAAILNDTPTQARKLNPELPAKLEQIISKAVEKDREMRYQTAAELRADLQEVAAALHRQTEGDRIRPSLVRFGIFELDLSAVQLCKQGRHIELQDQPFHVLSLLVQRPGEVVTREEVRRALWPADTFVEFDQRLNTAIKKIQQALDDSAENPRFIETIPRKGYRFIAPVSGLEIPARGAAGPVQRPSRLWLAAGLFLLAIVGFAGWLLNTRTGTSDAPLVPLPLTSYPGAEWHPSFSPDGNEVAFQWRRPEQDHSDIYVKLVGAGEPLRLTNGPAANYSPAWSPDGRSIAFLRKLPNAKSGVFLISPIGGSERKLSEVEPASCLAWHPSSKWLVITDKTSPEESPSLFSLSLENGEKRRLTSPTQKTNGDQDPAVSPGGDALVFTRNSGANTWDLYLVALSEAFTPKGQPRRITFDSTFSYVPAWMPDGRAIVYSSGSPHDPALYKIAFSRPGWRPGKPQRLAFASVGARNPTVSRQGRLAYSIATIDANIWRLELNGAGRTIKPPRRLIASTHLDHNPTYSPDGTRIAFASNRSGSHQIWVSNSDSSGTAQLTFFRGPGYTASPYWSPDGRQIYFGSTAEGQYGVYVISSEGGQPKRLGSEAPESWSRDGKWVYFHRGDEIWKRPAVGGGRMIQITRTGGAQAVESPDGRLLYYLKENKEFTSLWKVPVEGGPESQLLESVCCQNFAVVEQGIYFIPAWKGKDNSSVQFLSFASGKIATIATLSGAAAYGLSASYDGRWLLYSQYEPSGSDLWMVENFR